MLAHMVWNCALNTGSLRMSDLCFIANSSSLLLKVTSWSFICCRAALRTSSPADLNCSCAATEAVVDRQHGGLEGTGLGRLQSCLQPYQKRLLSAFKQQVQVQGAKYQGGDVVLLLHWILPFDAPWPAHPAEVQQCQVAFSCWLCAVCY